MRPMTSLLLIASLALPVLSLAQDNLHESRYEYSNGDELIVRWGETGYQPSGPAPDFAQLDRDGNGHISADEARGYTLLANDFKMADSNRDGRVSAAEYQRWKNLP